MILHTTFVSAIWCHNWGILFMIWLRTGFPRVPRRRSDKQAKNNEEFISERLVQASERKFGKIPVKKEGKGTDRREKKRKKKKKNKGKNCNMLEWKEEKEKEKTRTNQQ